MNRRTALVFLITIAVLGGIVYYLTVNPEAASNPTPTAPASAGSTTLWTIDSTLVKSLTVTDTVKALTFSAALDPSGQWMISQPQAGQADPAQMSTILSTVGSLYINRTITESVDLAEFGLTAPDYSIEVQTVDGAIFGASVGKQAVTGYAYYVLPADGGSVVLVGSSSLDTLLTLPSLPPLLAPTLEVTLEPLPALPLGTPSP
ncbi:MAG: DUF4340 domain-containing protein [Chloroflexi bacterium]|nr:DUF4340 domain-containing protein [Chloroflexota bacterium]